MLEISLASAIVILWLKNFQNFGKIAVNTEQSHSHYQDSIPTGAMSKSEAKRIPDSFH